MASGINTRRVAEITGESSAHGDEWHSVSPGGHWPAELGLIPAGEYGQPHSGAMSSASSVRVPRLTPHSDISRQGCGHQSSVGGTQHEGQPELPPQSKDGKESGVEGGMEGQRENFSRKELGEDSSVGESTRYANEAYATEAQDLGLQHPPKSRAWPCVLVNVSIGGWGQADP